MYYLNFYYSFVVYACMYGYKYTTIEMCICHMLYVYGHMYICIYFLMHNHPSLNNRNFRSLFSKIEFPSTILCYGMYKTINIIIFCKRLNENGS